MEVALFSSRAKIKNISVTFFLFLILFNTKILSQVNPDINFYPLHVGDIKQYLINQKANYPNGLDTTFFVTIEVISKEFIDGNSYFNISSTNPIYENGVLIRIDSANAAMWNTECMLDSLSMQLEEGFRNDCFGTVTCIAESEELYFGESRRVKEFNYNPAMTISMNKKYKYAYDIGLVNSIATYPDGVINSSLVYAKVNGVEYGDSTFCENKNIYFSEKKLNLFWNEFNPVLADTTWLINKSSEILMVDSVINNHGYSYSFDVLFSDSNSNSFSLLQNYMDIVAFSVNAYDSVQIVLSNPDLCPICDGSSSTKNFTDSLHIYTNSEKIPVLLLAVEGDGTLDAENINTENITFALQQNYPNPFNPSTVIRYSIPHSTEYYSVQHATLKVFDILGREVATLVNKHQKAGNYEVSLDASNLTSGIYLYRLQSGRMNINKKMILIK